MKDYHEYRPISDYGAIGNLRSVALVGRNGSIDWCCFPHISAESVFAAILDVRRGGRFSIAPAGANDGDQHYIEDTNILETVFQTDKGRLMVTDFMPLWGDIMGIGGSKGPDEIHRILRCDGGPLEIIVEWSPRPDYARASVDINRTDSGWAATSRDILMTLGHMSDGEVVDTGFGPAVRTRFRMKDGEQRALVASWNAGYTNPRLDESLSAFQRTADTWRNWVNRREIALARDWAGEWTPLLIRSALLLKLLTHFGTGGIAAAPTTSLPERMGGVRNWDYRFTWIRDASFTVQALSVLGHAAEAIDFLYWIERLSQRCDETERQVQAIYGTHGELDLYELELPHLEGYRYSRPVRVGNAAFKQQQLDLYGEVFDAAHELLRRGHEFEPRLLDFLQDVADQGCGVWHKPDYGIWEIRSEPRHFVYSKVMMWVMLKHAVRMAERYGLRGDTNRWRRLQGVIHKMVLERGFDKELGSFVQSFGSKKADASNLLIPLHGFLPFEDPRVQGTIDLVIERLMENDLVYRYENDDGLPGGEGAFCFCTFWLIDALSLSGRVDEARRIFESIASRVNHLGLLPEQLDPKKGEFLGNFPQAYSHIGLINSTLFLAYAEGKKIPEYALLGTRERRAEDAA